MGLAEEVLLLLQELSQPIVKMSVTHLSRPQGRQASVGPDEIIFSLTVSFRDSTGKHSVYVSETRGMFVAKAALRVLSLASQGCCRRSEL